MAVQKTVFHFASYFDSDFPVMFDITSFICTIVRYDILLGIHLLAITFSIIVIFGYGFRMVLTIFCFVISL